MGLMSTLALLTLPLLKRPELASKKLSKFLDPRIIENAALKSRMAKLEAADEHKLLLRIAKLQAEVEDLQRKLDDANRDAALARRAMGDAWDDTLTARRERDYWHGMVVAAREARDLGLRRQIDYGALQGFQQARENPVQQNNQALAQQAQAQQLPEAQYLAGLGQVVNPFHQLQHWGDCTCVPGRSAAFRTPGAHSDD